MSGLCRVYAGNAFKIPQNPLLKPHILPLDTTRKHAKIRAVVQFNPHLKKAVLSGFLNRRSLVRVQSEVFLLKKTPYFTGFSFFLGIKLGIVEHSIEI